MLGIAGARSGGEGSPAARWAVLPIVLIAAALVYVATQSLIGALAAVVIAAYFTGALVLGTTRLGVITLMGCFLTAPAYKGLVPGAGTVTPTDGLLVVGFALLLPVILKGRMHLPATYLVGATIVAISGMIATIGSDSMLESALGVTFWLFVMVALPIAVNMWQPSARVIRRLAWSYVAGHILSWVVGTALGHVVNGRYYGLTNHPNYFAEAGLMAVALLLYLFFQYDGWRARTVVVMFGVICSASVLMSGSRGATVVLAVLIVMIPVVERSAITGFLWAVGGAALVGLSPLLLNIVGQTASVSRLLGGGSAAGSDQVRSQGLQTGLQMVREQPVFGRGLVTADLFNIHNNYLEVAVAIGIVGLIGYVVVIYSFARPLFDNHVHRRLCYTVWAYIGWGATVPALYDRSIWVPMALTAICWARRPAGGDDAEATAKAAEVTQPIVPTVAVRGRD
ncbi:MAG: O-antigen ligase family protein [Nocardioidaceae bacterium]|nr:O-antigen ligase family protein [Nocardioidaceae bacterium]